MIKKIWETIPDLSQKYFLSAYKDNVDAHSVEDQSEYSDSETTEKLDLPYFFVFLYQKISFFISKHPMVFIGR